MIRRRTIGALSVPELGFGTAPLGNLYREIAPEDARATILAAQQAGLGYADTAPHYGLGLAEKRLGAALAAETIVSTKVGRVMIPAQGPFPPERNCFFTQEPFEPIYDYTHDGVLRSHDDSLARLGRDRIEILFIHDIGRLTHGDAHPAMLAQLFDGGGFRALQRLRDEGAIDAFGIGVNETEVAIEIMDRVHLDVILMAGRYTLLEQGALTDFFPRCQAEGTAIVIGGPYNSGLLTGGATYNYETAPAAIVERARMIEAVCTRHGVALGAAALQFPLAHPAVASVIPGLASIKEVQETVERHETAIPAALWDELKAEKLLSAQAPVPA
ncbi:aldo/keto reductase [Sphingomonas sp. LB-2]|uniref:aldo/keto reductase n=1 Tax=Sphingomonas caeni TaxID=2984949 RepID=UPI0022328BF7|nr:aldo/keto reductase [Sphingomonas caeni]MCW3848880.1 aldo/keto reductase [Sphingomonas caeni]